METKRVVILALFVAFLSTGFLVYFLLYNGKVTGNSVIGTARDSHGCLIHKGYTWNSSERSCVLEWVYSNSRYQINSFQSCVDAGYNITNISGSPLSCTSLNGTVFYEVSGPAVSINNSSESISNSSENNSVYFNLTNSS